MSTALILRDRNPDNDFVLRGGPPLYTERTSFYPTNSDITTTTKNLSQHGYRADRYQDFLQDDQNLRSSLRNMSRSLRMVSNDIKQNLQEESTAKRYLQTQSGTVFYQDGYKPEEYEDDRIPTRRPEDRSWLSNSEWNTSAGHHVTFSDNAPTETLLNRSPSFPVTQVLSRTGDNQKEAARLLRTVNTDMGLAEVPLTRFTRKDLLASEYFPVTMSSNVSEGSRSPRQSRSRTRSRERLAQSARMRAMTPERTRITDNFRDMKRLEKLYLVTAEAPATDDDRSDDEEDEYDCDDDDRKYDDTGCYIVQTLRATLELLTQVVVCSSVSAPPAILSPYLEEIAKLRMERIRLEEQHLKELNRLLTLERVRGPKPKWYELRDTQFHFEAGKNNDLLRSQTEWGSALKTGSQVLSRSCPDEFSLRTRAASFS